MIEVLNALILSLAQVLGESLLLQTKERVSVIYGVGWLRVEVINAESGLYEHPINAHCRRGLLAPRQKLLVLAVELC